MTTMSNITNAGSLDLEHELMCFICTEILYQPLTLLDCLHSFCGACLKEWFSHQYRKATASHSSSSSTNPYTCPTCRASVKDVQRYAMINNLVEKFLSNNPGRERTEEEKEEWALIYKPGDNILRKVDGRRRERRARRNEDATEARERRLLAEAQERSLRETHGETSARSHTLQPPSSRRNGSSRSREREERREQRREQGMQGQRQRAQTVDTTRAGEESTDSEPHGRTAPSAPIPSSSPRNPESVEARQRQQTVVHQASLTSLISSSEHGTGSSSNTDNQNLARIRQEIEGLGLLDGIDVEALTEAEQDELAERIVQAYQRHREQNQESTTSLEASAAGLASPRTRPNGLPVEESRRQQRSDPSNAQRRADTHPSHTRDRSTGARSRTTRSPPSDSTTSLLPPSSVTFTHRRRASSQGQRTEDSTSTQRQPSPAARSSDPRSHSAANITRRSASQDRGSTGRRTHPNPNTAHHQSKESRRSLRDSDNQTHGQTVLSLSNGSREVTAEVQPTITVQSPTSIVPPVSEVASIDVSSSRTNGPQTFRTFTNNRRHASGLYDEPSVSCYKCHRADIQYEVHRHCDKCDIDLCARCYRTGKGCKHWYGFGHAAIAQFESLQPASYESMELPHSLQLGRQYQRPEDVTIIRSKLAKDGITVIALKTTSNPVSRLQEGRFCDRCDKFANSCFWSCDYCNWGEWGFCRECVNTHHCCTHPLLPSAHKSYASASSTTRPALEHVNPTSSELLAANLRPLSITSPPTSATSITSVTAGPIPDFVNLVITTHCDICSQAISPSSLRFHCPFHPSPSSDNLEAQGDYDICTPCYQNLVKTNRIKRDDGSAGWRKCPSGHRLIITTFQPDSEGCQRRVIINDLVGGWKSPEDALRDWNAEMDTRRDYGNGEVPSSPDGSSGRRLARARTSSYPADPSSPTTSSPFNSSSRFPPDGGTGLRGVTWYSYFPDDADRDSTDLVFPSGAEIREIKVDEAYPDWVGGVYAGDRGLLPASYVRILN